MVVLHRNSPTNCCTPRARRTGQQTSWVTFIFSQCNYVAMAFHWLLRWHSTGYCAEEAPELNKAATINFTAKRY